MSRRDRKRRRERIRRLLATNAISSPPLDPDVIFRAFGITRENELRTLAISLRRKHRIQIAYLSLVGLEFVVGLAFLAYAVTISKTPKGFWIFGAILLGAVGIATVIDRIEKRSR